LVPSDFKKLNYILMKIKCIAIDDEQFALSLLEKYCLEVSCLDLVAIFSDPYEAINYLKSQTPDLIFLDIQMPGISGVKIAKDVQNKPMVIFTTAHSSYALEGFDLNVIDFLLKPFDFGRFMKAVEKVKEKFNLQNISKSLQTKNEYIIIKVEYKNVKILISDILYIEALDNYSKIFTIQKTHLTLQNLRKITSLLPENEFIRIHKSFIAAKSKISIYTREKVILGEKTLPVGRVYTENFLLRMSK
jgi:DNA-binding LytR/AlgR family response regulator